jgi:beta-glucosidase/6-phospho-beta-glucosidase/beta-galactosidase
MMRCHAAAYRAIKHMPGGNQVAVGIVLNVLWMEPRQTGAMFKHITTLSNFFSKVWDIQAAMNYLCSGLYTYSHPLGKFLGHVHWEDPMGKPGCDWLGINHYARAILDWNLSPSSKASSVILTDMGFPVDPHSLYMAVAWGSQLKVPMYIMESGAPFESDESGRAQFINSALQQVKQAVNDGYDLRGYHYWTLLDDYEFNYGYDLKFGLYAWDPKDKDSQRTERAGAKVLKGWFDDLADGMHHALLHHKGDHKTMRAGIRPKDCPTPLCKASPGFIHIAAVKPASRLIRSSIRSVKWGARYHTSVCMPAVRSYIS